LLLIKAEIERYCYTCKIYENIEKGEEEPDFDVKVPDLKVNK